MISAMSTIAEIEAAIERLPAPQVHELAEWLSKYRAERPAPVSVEIWLDTARGSARQGVTTKDVMTLTRGEE
jgi:hypothetical protein